MERDYNNSSSRPRGGYSNQGNRARDSFSDSFNDSDSSCDSNDYSNSDYNDSQSQSGYSPRSYDSRGSQGGYRNNYGNQGYGGRGGYSNQDGYGISGRYGGGYGGRYGGRGGYGGHGGYEQQGYGPAPSRYSRRPSKSSALAPRRPKPSDMPSSDIDPMDPDSFYETTGILETHPNGYGFLRDPKQNYIRQYLDPFVPGSVCEKLGLREGVQITGLVQPARGSQGPRVREVYNVDGMAPEEYIKVRKFDELTPINPEEWLRLENEAAGISDDVSMRVMDILTPLGKGQRALIVAPPRSGKTVLLQKICQAVTLNYPEVHVIVLLIDERPEEVTDFKRAVDAEVVASSLDCELESHIRLAKFVIERCKRLTEMGKDVFLLLDSITRLARAFNKSVGNTGRTMTGGLDIKAMDVPKKIFSSARAIEGGGSLTIVGTALVDTGSRMDELIFQEFKGTGNMELVLDRHLADRRIWPAIDISQSGTRREERLLPPDNLKASFYIRRVFATKSPVEAMETLTAGLRKYPTNNDFFAAFSKKNS